MVLDDAPNTCPGYAVEVGTHRYLDDFDQTSDQDWYTFQADAGRMYTIQTSELEARADTTIVLYSSDCTTRLADNDDISWPGNIASRIVWTAPSAGTYHALVYSYDWQIYGAETGYIFDVSAGGAGMHVGVEHR